MTHKNCFHGNIVSLLHQTMLHSMQFKIYLKT